MKVVVKYGMSPAARIELLADSSILTTGRPLFVPDWAASFTATLSVAARVSRLGKCIAPQWAHRYWDAITGCLLTGGVDHQGNAIALGALSRSHDGALVLGQMVSKEETLVDGGVMDCMVDGMPAAQVQLPHLSSIIDETICQVSEYMTVKMGDLFCICCGCSLPLAINTRVELSLDGLQLLKTKIK